MNNVYITYVHFTNNTIMYKILHNIYTLKIKSINELIFYYLYYYYLHRYIIGIFHYINNVIIKLIFMFVFFFSL